MKHWTVAAALTASLLFASAASGGPVVAGSKAPEIKLKTAGGTETALSSYVGRKNVLVMFLRRGGSYYARPGKLEYVARPVKRLYYERERLAGYGTEAIVVYPGPFTGKPSEDKEVSLTLHDPDGAAYAAYGLNMAAPGKGQWGAFFIDTKGVVQLAYRPYDWQTKKKLGREHVDLLDVYADIEKKLSLANIPPAAKVVRFRQGVAPRGYVGCTALQIWPRYNKPASLAGKQTAFVRS